MTTLTNSNSSIFILNIKKKAIKVSERERETKKNRGVRLN